MKNFTPPHFLTKSLLIFSLMVLFVTGCRKDSFEPDPIVEQEIENEALSDIYIQLTRDLNRGNKKGKKPKKDQMVIDILEGTGFKYKNKLKKWEKKYGKLYWQDAYFIDKYNGYINVPYSLYGEKTDGIFFFYKNKNNVLKHQVRPRTSILHNLGEKINVFKKFELSFLLHFDAQVFNNLDCSLLKYVEEESQLNRGCSWGLVDVVWECFIGLEDVENGIPSNLIDNQGLVYECGWAFYYGFICVGSSDLNSGVNDPCLDPCYSPDEFRGGENCDCLPTGTGGGVDGDTWDYDYCDDPCPTGSVRDDDCECVVGIEDDEPLDPNPFDNIDPTALLSNPTFKCLYEKFCEGNSSVFNSTIGAFSDTHNDIIFKDTKSLDPNDPKDNECYYSSGCSRYDENTGNVTIYLNLNEGGLDMAATILHEGIHAAILAELENLGVNVNLLNFNEVYSKYKEKYHKADADHFYMTEVYIKPIAQALRQIDNYSSSLSSYYPFAWDGLRDYGRERNLSEEQMYTNTSRSQTYSKSFLCK